MALNNLAPDIQQEILHLPRVESGRDPITERDLLVIVAAVDAECSSGTGVNLLASRRLLPYTSVV